MEDYNVEVTETNMQEFCESYFLDNIVKKPTCFKNPAKPVCIDLIITNRAGMFRNARILVKSIMKVSYQKKTQLPRMIKYSDYFRFSNEHFKDFLSENLAHNTHLDYNSFEEIVLNLLSSQVLF